MRRRLLLGVIAALVACYAQPPPSRPFRFLPPGATITKQLRLDLEGDGVAEIVQSYLVPDQVNDIYYTQSFNVLKFSRTGGWTVAYKETERGNPGSDDLVTEVVGSSSGKQAIVVILKHSGAGTATFWHIVASIDGKIGPIEAVSARAKALARRGYEDKGYNSVKVDGARIVENLAGYSRGQARCCPNRPSLILSFKFTGRTLDLDSVNEVPYERPPGAIGPLLRLNENGLAAYGYQLLDGFLVYAGSECPKDVAPSTPTQIVAARKSLVEDETLADSGDYFVLGRTYKFPSKSIATSVMMGRDADADAEWTDEVGRPVSSPRQAIVSIKVLGVSGVWQGEVERNGSRQPIVAKLEGRGHTVVGTVAIFGDGKALPIQHGEISGDLVSFDAQESINTIARFRLTLAGGQLRGERRRGNETWRVVLSRFNNLYADVPDLTSDPALTHRVDPKDPDAARTGRQISIVLQAEIDETGRVIPERIKVLRPLQRDFDEHVVESVKQWSFQPAFSEGKAVPSTVSIEILFQP